MDVPDRAVLPGAAGDAVLGIEIVVEDDVLGLTTSLTTTIMCSTFAGGALTGRNTHRAGSQSHGEASSDRLHPRLPAYPARPRRRCRTRRAPLAKRQRRGQGGGGSSDQRRPPDAAQAVGPEVDEEDGAVVALVTLDQAVLVVGVDHQAVATGRDAAEVDALTGEARAVAVIPAGGDPVGSVGSAARIGLLAGDGRLAPDPVARIAVAATGEGGLLGLAVDPSFQENGFVYAYRTTADGNEVVRLSFDGDRLHEPRVLVRGIPAAPIHNGGRLRFGPDRFLYITTGDATDPNAPQDPDSLGGKVLRLTPAQYRGADGTARGLLARPR